MSSYNLRCGITVIIRNIKKNEVGFENNSTVVAMLWNDLPAGLKNAEDLKIFKQRIKLSSPNDFPSKIC